ncbi:MAG: hypothetical protein ACRDJP_13760, partial [Actinomycetota bacterium]
GLGVDHLFVLARGGGTVERWDGEAWAAAGSVAVEVDDAANTVAALLPFALPATGTLRAVSVLGYETGETSWRTGEVPVHDLAFVTAGSPAIPYLESVTTAVTGFGGDGEKQWQEYEQSAILAGNAAPGPDGAGVAEIDVAKLQAGATELAAPDAKGFHTFLYRSSIDLGEGVEGSGNGAVYNGPYQPYLVWVPGKDRLKPGLPLVLYLHGSSQTHLSAVNVAHYDPASQQAGRPDAIFDFDAVVAWPLGRGPQTWYEGPAELDPLEVADDVVARLALDRDRVMLAGLSMGGYGTFRLAERYPDRWSVAYVDVAGDEVGLVENLTALPVRMQNGVADPLIPLKELSEGNDPTWRRTQGLLAAAGTVDYRSWVLTTGTHGPAIAVAECVYRESFDRPRVTNPMQVRYTVDPTSFVDDPASGLRLVYEGAYWVSGMRAAADDQPGSVDLVTRAFTTLPPATPPPVTDTAHENLTHAEDFCGTDTTVRTRQSWMEQARRIVPVANPVPERIVTGTLSGLSAVTVAADRAGLGGRAPASLRLTVVGPAAVDLTITGLASGSAVTAAGRTVRADGSGVATVPLPAGGPGPVTVTIR